MRVCHARLEKKKVRSTRRDRKSSVGSKIACLLLFSRRTNVFSTNTVRATLDVSDFRTRWFLIDTCQSDRRGALAN